MNKEKETQETAAHKPTTATTICLNCGAECNGRYCHNCGQSTDTTRFSIWSLFTSSTRNLTRISNGFFDTLWGLAIHPWAVIRDYIHGRRIRYTAPVAMLLIMLFYTTAITHLCGLDQMESIETIDGVDPEKAALWEFIDGSTTFQFLILAIPISIATYIAYLPAGSRRYNIAEQFVATIYFCCTFLIYNTICIPLEFIDGALANLVIITATGIMGIISLWKAYHADSIFKHILLLLGFLILNTIFIVISLMIMIFPFINFSE